MIYLCIAAAVIAAVIWFVFRISPKDRQLPYSDIEQYRYFCSNLRARTLALAKDERLEMVAEARRLAGAGYDRLFEGAKQLGKDDSFAHQAGVLDAVFCVFANDDRMRQHSEIRKLIQLETLPFNLSPISAGKREIIEYLVWKISPQDADLALIETTVSRFVKQIEADAEGHSDPVRLIQTMIYANQFDWQRIAIGLFDKYKRS